MAEHHQKVALPNIPDRTPMVLANCFDGRGSPSVLPDVKRGQHDLVARLIRAGHRRIGYLTLRPAIAAGTLRTQAAAPPSPNPISPMTPPSLNTAIPEGRDGETQLLWDAVDRLLRLSAPPTAFFCGNDNMALRAYGLLRSMGRKVPTEVSVAGYDEYRVIAKTLYPPLTTMDLPCTAMGVRAAQRLMAMISGAKAVQV